MMMDTVIDDGPPDVWQLTYDDRPEDAFPDGLRLSTDCVARRIIEPLDPERYFAFPEHLGHRGHGFERVVQEWLIERLDAVAVLREIVVPWEYGESHLDLLVDPSTAARVWGCTHGGWLLLELKANKEAQVKTENIRQVQRQAFAVERAVAAGKRIRYQERITVAPVTLDDGFGTPDAVARSTTSWEWRTIPLEVMANLEYRILVVDPTTWRVPNPKGVRVTITDERRAELEAEWATMIEAMSRGAKQLRHDIEWPGKIATCTCGKCDPEQQVFELPTSVVEAAHRYLHAMEEEADAKAAKALEASIIKPAIEKLIERWPDLLEKKQTFVGGGVKVTRSKTGSLRVTPSDAKPTPLF